MSIDRRALVLLLGVTACAGPTYVTAEPVAADHTITVSGSAGLDLVPDEACIELTLAARDASMTAAHTTLVASHDALLAELRPRQGLAVEKGATSYAPEYDGSARIVRYIASTQVNVRTRDFPQIPDVIGRASAHGLDRVSVVYYSTQIISKKAEVRAQALEAARQKAQAMTTTLGVSLGDVVTIAEGDSHMNASTGSNSYLERAAVDKTSDAPAAPESIPLQSNVTVVYRLR